MSSKEPNYFLISVSNRENLKLCTKYAMAGFTNSINGFWTYSEIDVGDYISFLYGARVRNLYRVVKKQAYKNANGLGPWPDVTFRMSGNTYNFPFRLFLKQERKLNEPMVRPEFSYVAENLLLRGGYRKTHFQEDIITLYKVLEMGEKFEDENEKFEFDGEPFEPKIVFERKYQKISEKFYFKELILQSLVRRKIKSSVLTKILNLFNIDYSIDDFEVLGEKALPEGFVDIFIKLKHPSGENKFLLVEVKKGKAQKNDFKQVKGYIDAFGSEAVGGVLIAKNFPKNISKGRILAVKYSFKNRDSLLEYTYNDLLQKLLLEVYP